MHRFYLWVNAWTGTTMLCSMVTDFAVRSFTSEVAAQNWCAANGVAFIG